MKISGDKIELSELFTGLVLKSRKTKVEVAERDGGFFIQFNGVEIRLIENNPVQIETLSKKENDIVDYAEELAKMLEDKEKKEAVRDTIYKPAFMPTFTPYVPIIDPSKVTCHNLKTNILEGVNEL